MAVIKKRNSVGGNNSQFRYLEIDKCLSNTGRKWTWQELLKKVNMAIELNFPESEGIARATLFEDLNNMQSIYKDKVEMIKRKDGRTSFWSYSKPGDSIFGHLFNETEVKKLKEAVAVISKFSGAPQFDWLQDVIPVIESKMGFMETGKEIISFDYDLQYSGVNFIPPLFNAILNQRELRVTYQSFKSSTPIEISVHPQYLKQYNSRWFLFSFVDKWGNKPQVHALDRMKEIHETGTPCKSPIGFDWDDYFFDIVGVTKDNSTPVEVRILIMDEEQAAYIDTKPLHHSQKKLRKIEGGFETRIKVIPNFELEKLLLSFGERIKVVSPPSLIEKIKQRVNIMRKQYSI